MIVSTAINFGKLIADGRAWRVDGRAQALVGPGLATPLIIPLGVVQSRESRK